MHFQILGFLFLSHMHLLFVPLDEIVFLAFSDGLYRDKNIFIGNFYSQKVQTAVILIQFPSRKVIMNV